MASIVALGIGLSGLPPASAAQSATPRTTAEPVAAKVTLITGDRVAVSGQAVAIEPGPGRRGIAFQTYRLKDHLYVVPSDIRAQLTSGRLDRRLFDVTGLITAKYDDQSTTSIPVIVTYTGTAQKRAATPGATVTRQLPVVNGAALKVDKAKAKTFLTGVGTARSAAGVAKIWLDGKRELTLDKSVAQIGAPIAWQAGFTGKGVKVAVLDSGIDAKHPDLATQVAGAKNFTPEEDADLVGHGTHVASTIAGTGAASNGKYKGVAPDAKLYDGKVCMAAGCPDSAILAGMDWAANVVQADVVNLSLGGMDTPGIDPMEEAVNRLTATTGTLFVIASGNSGPGDRTVGSPGSADAALTVGAVDKQDELAEFSSAGPRIGDNALKPDVTAPGVDIMAAKANSAPGDQYVAESGTSMATPHTVGAAAILAQQHPAWQAAELKGALIAAAKPAANQTAFQQGAGRIDVARGTKQALIVDNLSFGTALYPHADDEPVIKPLTYRNLGDQPVTLNLSATLNAPDGTPAPAGSLELSANTVTIPAGGTASVQATSNTKHDGADGDYSGRVTATSGEVSVVAAIGVVKEKESYTLTLKGIGPNGEPAGVAGEAYGIDLYSFTTFDDKSGEVRIRLPKGEYLVDTAQHVPNPAEPAKSSHYQLVQPKLELGKDTTVVFDARTAKPVKVTVPNTNAAPLATGVGYNRRLAGGGSLSPEFTVFDFGTLYTAQVGPDLPATELTGNVSSQWAQPTADGRFTNSPYRYAQLNVFPGKYPTGFQRDVKAGELAEINQTINKASDNPIEHVLFGKQDAEYGATALVPYDQPASVKLLVDAALATWSTQVFELTRDDDIVTLFQSPYRSYQAGRTYRGRHNAAAFTPAPQFAFRNQNRMELALHPVMDADGNKGDTRDDTGVTRLLSGGKVLAETNLFGYVEAENLPAGKATYTLQGSQTRQSYSTFSTRTDLTWTFTSGTTPQETVLPMVGLRYQPKVDRNNVARRTPTTVLPIGIEVQKGATLPGIRKLELQVSGDDGLTWRKAVVTARGAGAYQAVFVTPKGAKTVSLKAHVVDSAGNVTDLTTIGAYPLG
ncbi:S8 family serine peptidase [Kribbella antibiotica]|uniref:S8 family serine peptidase n=1 Tax=Kribbella antibiotica TaxID=190195 RepID=UPI001EE03238|nr:S8 family serine peptidase [Kribbella antibiotica]